MISRAEKRKARKRLSRELLKANVKWSKGVLAYRLLFMFAPVALSKRLARHFKNIQAFPGLDVPGMPEPEPGEVIIPTQPPAPPPFEAPTTPPGAPAEPEEPTPPPEEPFIVIPPPSGWWLPPTISTRYIDGTVLHPTPEFFPPGPPHRPNPSPEEGTAIKIIGETSDGLVTASGTPWQTMHDAASGTSAASSEGSDTGTFSSISTILQTVIRRGFFEFDMSSIPAGKQITAVSFFLTMLKCDGNAICFQESSFVPPLSVSDYSNFSGDVFCAQTVNVPIEDGAVLVEFAFNAIALAFFQSKIGDMARICGRMYWWDFLNHEPPDERHTAGCYFSEIPEGYGKPYLMITYS